MALLGLMLSFALAGEAHSRGLGEGRDEAAMIARTAVEPQLDGRPLNLAMPGGEVQALRRLADRAVTAGSVVRIRLRDTNGHVVFSDDGSGFNDEIEDEALDAAHGEVVAHLTRLNADSNDTGPVGERVVEVYVPLSTGGPVLGVLEIYLPYAPIATEVSAGLRTLYLVLGVGLAALWAILALISASTMRRMVHLAEHDALTGLPNRILFQRRAAAAIEAAKRDGGIAAVVLADVDRFKEVNDTLGHHNGDALLRELASRLAAGVRSGDTVARLGGDEFGLVLPGIGNDEIQPLLDRLRAVLEAEAIVGTLPLSPEASFGYALAPADGTDVDTLLRRADMAMYLAKGTRTGTARYDQKRDHYDAGQLALVAELRRAIETGELVLFYQPKAELRTGRVCAVEALIRWRHPVRGLVPPDAFLPVAEQTGLIDALTRWVLATALAQVVAWGPAFEGLSMSVNVSARNLARADFADTVLAALTTAGVPATLLVVEITETALMTDPEVVADVLARLSTAGVRISVDDFGQGQTSLGYLSTLPLHELKIDKSFICDLPDNMGHAAIVRSVVDLGHNLGLQVVAEGVETQPTVDLLTATGCDVAQGYLLARPMPADDLAPWLADHRAGALTVEH
ncbi:bifunctional diguanylate cyclase/phosphodiesterase [Actinoplanes sp. NPDC051411]|uniref:putative bifunctional diguanylate cyclase/phosphodiesterase n=1 Tax=Actinoplanes sp. NPDC051411 TaxID=3155522 RepID=UPI00343665FC